MKYENRIEPISVADIGFNAPLIPFTSMTAANNAMECFISADKPKGILLVTGPVGVGKTHFLRSWAKIFNFQTGKVYVANFHATEEWINFDFSEYKEKVLVFIFSEEALLRRRDYTIALWKKLLVTDIVVMAEVPSDFDVSGLAIEFGSLLTIVSLSPPTKRDRTLFALSFYNQRVPLGRPHLQADFFKQLIAKTKSLREIQTAILREKLLYESRVK